MEKTKLKILVINRSLEKEEKPFLLFKKYRQEGYDVIIFPFTEKKKLTEVIFFNYSHLSDFEELFCITIEYDLDGDESCFDFDLKEIDEQSFYDVLDQRFEIHTVNLTDIEKKSNDN